MSNRRELIWGLLHSVRSWPKIFDWPVVRVSFQLRRDPYAFSGARDTSARTSSKPRSRERRQSAERQIGCFRSMVPIDIADGVQDH